MHREEYLARNHGSEVITQSQAVVDDLGQAEGLKTKAFKRSGFGAFISSNHAFNINIYGLIWNRIKQLVRIIIHSDCQPVV